MTLTVYLACRCGVLVKFDFYEHGRMKPVCATCTGKDT